MKVALTIAGSDSGGGAGIQADLKTFAAFGVYGVSAITAITAQSTTGIEAAVALEADLVTAQIEAVAGDLPIAATKIGMLANAAIAEAVAAAIEELELPLVVLDPVLVSSSGERLLDEDGVRALCTELIPLARVVTPNVPEAERLTGLKVRDREGMLGAARALREMGARAVLVKGGHLEGDATDVLLDEDGRVKTFTAARIDTNSTHGTGCTLAAALAACLARGLNLEESVAAAKRFVTEAIRRAPVLGRGHGPVNHSVAATF